MVLETLIWCESSADIGLGHYNRSYCLYKDLKKCVDLKNLFLHCDFPDDGFEPDLVIFDGIFVPENLTPVIANSKLKILLSPVCSDYSIFDYYVGRISPLQTPDELKTYIYEVNFNSELEKLRKTSKSQSNSASVCLSGGTYQQELIPEITHGLISSNLFDTIHFPEHYKNLDLPKTNDIFFKFHKKDAIWSSEFGNSKLFVGSDGVMIFEALLLNKSIISITSMERSYKVDRYFKQQLLDIIITDKYPNLDLSLELREKLLHPNTQNKLINDVWYKNKIVSGSKIIKKIIQNEFPQVSLENIL